MYEPEIIVGIRAGRIADSVGCVGIDQIVLNPAVLAVDHIGDDHRVPPFAGGAVLQDISGLAGIQVWMNLCHQAEATVVFGVVIELIDPCPRRRPAVWLVPGIHLIVKPFPLGIAVPIHGDAARIQALRNKIIAVAAVAVIEKPVRVALYGEGIDPLHGVGHCRVPVIGMAVGLIGCRAVCRCKALGVLVIDRGPGVFKQRIPDLVQNLLDIFADLRPRFPVQSIPR